MKCNKLIICGFTKIYLNRFYIPELIRLANDLQTTQVDPTKIIAAPYSQGNVEVFGTANGALLNTGMEGNGIYRNKPEYAGMRRNNTGMKRNEQEWYRNISEPAGMTPE